MSLDVWEKHYGPNVRHHAQCCLRGETPTEVGDRGYLARDVESRVSARLSACQTRCCKRGYGPAYPLPHELDERR